MRHLWQIFIIQGGCTTVLRSLVLLGLGAKRV